MSPNLKLNLHEYHIYFSVSTDFGKQLQTVADEINKERVSPTVYQNINDCLDAGGIFTWNNFSAARSRNFKQISHVRFQSELWCQRRLLCNVNDGMCKMTVTLTGW